MYEGGSTVISYLIFITLVMWLIYIYQKWLVLTPTIFYYAIEMTHAKICTISDTTVK